MSATDFWQTAKRPLSDDERAAIEKVLASVSLVRDGRKRKRLIRRARQEARLVELGREAKAK